MLPPYLLSIVLALLLCCPCRAGNSVENVERISTATCFHLDDEQNHECEATLTRYKDLGAISISVDELSGFNTDHAYTIWLSDKRCGNCNDPNSGERQLYNLGGFVYTDSDDPELPLVFNVPDYNTAGDGSIPTSCPDGLPEEGTCVLYDDTELCSIIMPRPDTCQSGVECFDTDLSDLDAIGLRDAWTDVIFIAFKDHGPFTNDDALQTSTFNGGCTLEGINFPKDFSICPKDDGGYECTDRARAEF